MDIILVKKGALVSFSLWNESTRTPFIIYDPRNDKGNGKECSEPVGLINVYKTLADLTNLDPPEYIDGQSLVPWIKNPSLPKSSPAMTTWEEEIIHFEVKSGDTHVILMVLKSFIIRLQIVTNGLI